MKIRMSISVAGTFEGYHDVHAGDVVEVDDARGARYCAMHYATPVVDRKEERAVAPAQAEERAAEVGDGRTEEAEMRRRGPGRPPRSAG